MVFFIVNHDKILSEFHANNRRENRMIGILYFSATGNSLFIAEKIKKAMGGQILYIPNYRGNGSEFERIIIVTPIYSYGMPSHIYDLLPKLDHEKELIVVQNYGGMVGGADYYTYKYALKNGLNIKSIYTIKMPENYTLTFSMPKFYLQSVLKTANRRTEAIIDKIIHNQFVIPHKKRTKERTYLKNKGNWHLIGKRFSVLENCVKCGKCVDLCPAKNIRLENNHIVFLDSCVACLGCYHRCPKKAIVYLNKRRKDRYINPFIDENLIGKDLK